MKKYCKTNFAGRVSEAEVAGTPIIWLSTETAALCFAFFLLGPKMILNYYSLSLNYVNHL